MTMPRDPDEILSAWLGEGPTRLPDQTRRAIAVAIPTTAQRRHGWIVPWRPFPTNPIARTALAVLALAIAIGGTMFVLGSTDRIAAPAVSPSASVPSSPEIVIPAGAVSTRTMEEVAAAAQVRNAEMERELGRALAPFRIIRIQLLRPGDSYTLRHLDGTVSPDRGGGIRTGGDFQNDVPTWVVETTGTYVRSVPGTGAGYDERGTHGFVWLADNDNGGERFIPCWSRLAVEPTLAPAEMEGTCP